MEKNDAEKKRKKKLLDHKGRLREPSDSTRQNNICIMGVPDEEEWGGKGQKFYLNKL